MLQHLFLSGNAFGGEIPQNIGTLTQLKSLELNSNDFSGVIPSTIGNLTQLESLRLSYNNLTGDIPGSFGNLTKLTRLELISNSGITELIPSSLANLVLLQTLSLSNTILTDTHISYLAAMNLTDLRVSGYVTENQLPSSISSLSNLTYLSISNNGLIGKLPTSLGSLVSLTQLIIANNNLEGGIIDELSSLTNLTVLNLQNNDLDGPIPGWIGDLTELTHLSLNLNRLTSIPYQIGSLENLQRLMLGKNLFSGDIPSTLVDLKNLTILDLSGKTDHDLNNLGLGDEPSELYRLTGSIPSGLARLPLYYLNLKDNKLTGELPRYYNFSRFVANERNAYLDLGNNSFTIEELVPFAKRAARFNGGLNPSWLRLGTQINEVDQLVVVNENEPVLLTAIYDGVPENEINFQWFEENQGSIGNGFQYLVTPNSTLDQNDNRYYVEMTTSAVSGVKSHTKVSHASSDSLPFSQGRDF